MMAERDVFAALDDIRASYTPAELSKLIKLINALIPLTAEQTKMIAMITWYNDVRKTLAGEFRGDRLATVIRLLRGVKEFRNDFDPVIKASEEDLIRFAKKYLNPTGSAAETAQD